MLLRFGAANHRSIRDYQELFLSASKRIKHDRLTFQVPVLQEAAIPIVAVYGQNASGKSNLIDALDEMQRRIVNSHVGRGATDRIPHYPFLLEKTDNRPTRFDCTFAFEPSKSSELDAVYEYGFEFNRKNFSKEWLYRIVRKERQSTQVLFERKETEGKPQFEFGSQLHGENKTIGKLTRPNSLYLSAAAQNNHPLLTQIFEYFALHWNTILANSMMNDSTVAKLLYDYEYTEPLLQLIRQADLGIINFDVEEVKPDDRAMNMAKDLVKVVYKHIDQLIDDDSFEERAIDEIRQSKRLRFFHSTQDNDPKNFAYRMESKGTRLLISLLIPALEALSKGSLFIVDELDTSLHPDLSRALVSLFKKEESNPHGAQLIFSTHDVTLLGSGLLENDEIWIAEKDEGGVSRFTPFSDFKVRSRDNVENAYRQGRLGGIPISNDFFFEFKDHTVS